MQATTVSVPDHPHEQNILLFMQRACCLLGRSFQHLICADNVCPVRISEAVHRTGSCCCHNGDTLYTCGLQNIAKSKIITQQMFF